MKRPEQLINNALFRALVNTTDLLTAREVLRRALLPLALPPARRRRVRERVAGHLRRCFPGEGEAAVRARAEAFIYHWSAKFAEDALALNLGGLEQWRRAVNRHVQIRAGYRVRAALDRGRGILLVGSHVGSTSFCTNALLSVFSAIPAERWPVARLCAEPEIEAFPHVKAKVEEVLRDYGGDVGFIYTSWDRQRIARTMTETLDGGGLVSTNLDVLLGGSSSLPFSLFGGRARVYLPALVGAARAALRSGATVLPWVNHRTETGFSIAVERPIGPLPRLGRTIPDDHPELLALCEALRGRLERWITARPEQWVYWDRLHHRLVQEPAPAERGAR